MNKSTTLKFVVEGDTYQELITKAETRLSNFIEADSEDDFDFDIDFDEDEYENSKPTNVKVDYELAVTEESDISTEFQYSAQVTARIKDVRR